MVVVWDFMGIYPLVIKHGWPENHLSMDVLIGKSLINGPFSIAMFDCPRVCLSSDMLSYVELDAFSSILECIHVRRMIASLQNNM